MTFNSGIVRSVVSAHASRLGYGNRTREINGIVADISNGRLNQADLQSTLSGYGLGRDQARSVANQVFADITAQSSTSEPVSTPETFDKATASAVVRAFITDGQPHLRSAGVSGASPEQVTALLQIAGLEDVPEPEPETPASTSVDAGLFSRLVEFAKGHGFRA